MPKANGHTQVCRIKDSSCVEFWVRPFQYCVITFVKGLFPSNVFYEITKTTDVLKLNVHNQNE